MENQVGVDFLRRLPGSTESELAAHDRRARYREAAVIGSDDDRLLVHVDDRPADDVTVGEFETIGRTVDRREREDDHEAARKSPVRPHRYQPAVTRNVRI
ncbi:MAG: hypothetical protein ACOC7V_10605 [Spirochaetota bacterium]